MLLLGHPSGTDISQGAQADVHPGWPPNWLVGLGSSVPIELSPDLIFGGTAKGRQFSMSVQPHKWHSSVPLHDRIMTSDMGEEKTSRGADRVFFPWEVQKLDISNRPLDRIK